LSVNTNVAHADTVQCRHSADIMLFVDY